MVDSLRLVPPPETLTISTPTPSELALQGLEKYAARLQTRTDLGVGNVARAQADMRVLRLLQDSLRPPELIAPTTDL